MKYFLFFFSLFICFSYSGLPSQISGGWVLTDDITVSMPSGWTPKIRSEYSFNTYWLSFLNPKTIFSNGQANNPPSSFTQFSSNRDKVDGPKSSDKVIYSIGGYSYSQGGYSWSIFDSTENAITFAKAVVQWKNTYKMDGFDLDWETSSLSDTQKEAILTFINTVKQLDSSFIITMEEAGYPQYATSLVIQYANSKGQLSQLIQNVDAFNVMFYSTDQTQSALTWVKTDWQKDCTNWCPLGTIIPSRKIVLGVPGCCDQGPTSSIVKNFLCSKGNDGSSFAGFMIWYIGSDSTPKIEYQGSCGGSGGCEMIPDNYSYFNSGSCSSSFLWG